MYTKIRRGCRLVPAPAWCLPVGGFSQGAMERNKSWLVKRPGHGRGSEKYIDYTFDSLNDNNKLLIPVSTFLQSTPDLSSISLDALAASVFTYLSDR